MTRKISFVPIVEKQGGVSSAAQLCQGSISPAKNAARKLEPGSARIAVPEMTQGIRSAKTVVRKQELGSVRIVAQKTIPRIRFVKTVAQNVIRQEISEGGTNDL